MSKKHNEQGATELKKELNALRNMHDRDIDYSDIPPSAPEQWQDARVSAFYRPEAPSLRVRIDADIVNWLTMRGKDDSARVNDLLRQRMRKETRQTGHPVQ